MIQTTKQKEIYLTAAQYAARETAGTLEQGVVYHITDGKIDEADLTDAVKKGVVFWVNKGVTTYNEVLEAYNAGKLCAFYESAVLWVLSAVMTGSGRILFKELGYDSYLRTTFIGTNNQWYPSTTSLEREANKVTTLSASSTNAQYPSAKAVYDFVQSAIVTTINTAI